MTREYEGSPDMQTVPIGWFRDAFEVAKRAEPGGYAVTIQLYDNGFEVIARSGDKIASERLEFFSMAMEAETGNPFPRLIGRAIDAIRGVRDDA